MDETLKRPLVSVVLPVYNGSEYLSEAITSILGQTYPNFELIIIDDGSTDDSAAIISSFRDGRIRFLQQENRGIVATLNRGIELAGGRYIARQDADDMSLPERFSRQVSFLESHPEYGMVGTWAEIWQGRAPGQHSHRWAPDDLALKFDLLFDNPFVHSSMMVRKSALHEVGLYSMRGRAQYPEDYELWSRIARRFKVANIPEVLHIYREVPRSLSRTGERPFLKHLIDINNKNMAWATESAFSEQSYQDLAALWHGAYRQYSRKTSVRDLVTVIETAARFLTDQAGVEPSALQGRVVFAVDNLRHHHFQASFWGRQINSARSMVKAVLRGVGLGFKECGGDHAP